MQSGRNRQNGYDSQRPVRNYSANSDDSEPQPGSIHRRPSGPSRQGSRWDQRSRVPGSPGATSSNSTHSPQSIHGQSDVLANKPLSETTRDPRRARGLVIDTARPSAVSLENNFAIYFRELAQLARLEGTLAEDEEKLRLAMSQEQDTRRKFPDPNALVDMYATNRKKAEDVLFKSQHAVTELREKVDITVKNLPAGCRDLLAGKFPSEIQRDEGDKRGEMQTSMVKLMQKIDQLDNQVEEQRKEIARLKGDRNRQESGKDFNPFENKIESQITAATDKTDVKLAALDGRFLVHSQSMALHEGILEKQKAELDKQREDVDSLMSKSNDWAKTLMTVQEELEIDKTGVTDSMRDTPRSPPNHGLDANIIEINDVLKQQKKQIANLSNTFVGRQEYQEHSVELHSLKKLAEKLQRDLDQTQQKMTTILAQTDNAADKADMSEIKELSHEVKRLSKFSKHYTDFYDQTQKDLKELKLRSTTTSGKLAEVEKGLGERLGTLQNRLHANQQQFDDRLKQYNDLDDRMRTSSAAATSEIENLKISVEQTGHSIQSLDTRYSAISTQKLYNSIVATMQPLLPQLYEVSEQYQAEKNARIALEQDIVQLRAELQALQSPNKVTGDSRRTGSKSPRASHAVLLQQGSQLVGATETGALSAHFVPQPSVELQNHEGCQLGRNSDLHDQLVKQQTALDDQSQKMVDLASIVHEHIKKHDDLSQEMSATNASREAEINKGLEEMRASLKDIQTLVDRHKKDLKDQSKDISKLQAVAQAVSTLQTSVEAMKANLETQIREYSKSNADQRVLAKSLEELNKKVQAISESSAPMADKSCTGQTQSEPVRVVDKNESLSSRVDMLEDFAFDHGDRYVMCKNLASVITETGLRDRFKECTIRRVQFRGGKSSDGKTTRYALLWIAPSTNVDSAIQSVISEYDGIAWSGRRAAISQMDRDTFKDLWMEEPSPLNQTPSTRSGKHRGHPSGVTPIPSRNRDVSSTMASKMPIYDDNTIEVKAAAKSSVLPHKRKAADEYTELAESDPEKLLEDFGATRDGQRLSNRPLLQTSVSTDSRPGSVKGGTKHGRSSITPSQQNTKRSRRG